MTKQIVILDVFIHLRILMSLITCSENWSAMPAAFIEGALLAANANPKPLDADVWLPLMWTAGVEDAPAILPEDEKQALLLHFQQQYNAFQRGEYVLPSEVQWTAETGVTEDIQYFAEGFLTVWPYIADSWENVTVQAGTARMLSGLLMSLMLILDESGTLDEMKEAEVLPLPVPSDLYAQIPMMLTEVIMAADEHLQGAQAQQVNPYKAVGRNDLCVCGSGKKFKHCCGR